ncbi:3-oxoadipate enol-lactonase 2 [bacterium BMS3Abin03]|nr:3-oxoadipate enol-lactonase 2 [bacterium BMS3Abin03]
MKTTINELAVFTNGSDENKAIIFVHGFPYDHRMWNAQIEELSKNYYCVSYDIRGLGESPAGDGQFTIEMFVDDLEYIIDKLRLDRPVLCGLSMGGYISLRAIERMENKFSGLILCDTKASADNNAVKIKRAGAIKKINREGLNPFVDEFVRNCFGDDFVRDHKEEYDRVVSHSKENYPEGVKGCLLAMAARTDTTSYLSKIAIPVLLICGEEDKLTPPDVMMSMADKIHTAEFVVVEKAGHMTPVENSKEVNKHIYNFLKNSI